MSDTTMTTAGVHGLSVGDRVNLCRRNRLKELWMLLTKPRIMVVTQVTTSELTLSPQRMSWAEWRGCLALVFRRSQ